MKLAFATPTWIRTQAESLVVISTLKALGELDIPIVVVDGGSSRHDQNIIKAIPNVHFFESGGFFSDRLIMALKHAGLLAETIFYLQSDKLDFVQRSVSQLIKHYMSFTKPCMLVASRTKETIQRYPLFQQTQESFLNFFVGDFVGIPEDYFAGPKLFPSFLAPYLESIQGDIGWGVEAYLYVLAKRLDLPFHFFSIDMEPPVDVGNDEEIKKSRLKVTQAIIDGFLQAQNLNLPKRNLGRFSHGG